jgi:hypothetical protein
LELLTPYLLDIDRARNLKALHCHGRWYSVRIGEDDQGRLLFIIYERASAEQAMRLSFRRNRDKYPLPPRSGIIYAPAPVLWAMINGESLPLGAEQFTKWARDLDRAAGPDARRTPWDSYHETEVDARYPLPFFPIPPTLIATPGTDDLWARFEMALGRRLRRVRRMHLFLVWVHMATRWQAQGKQSGTGLPRLVEITASYLEVKLRMTRKAARGAMDDLERLGLIVPAAYIAPKETSRQRGHFSYLPGTGVPLARGAKLRVLPITPHDSLARMRAFVASARARRGELASLGPYGFERDSFQENVLPKGRLVQSYMAPKSRIPAKKVRSSCRDAEINPGRKT